MTESKVKHVTTSMPADSTDVGREDVVQKRDDVLPLRGIRLRVGPVRHFSLSCGYLFRRETGDLRRRS